MDLILSHQTAYLYWRSFTGRRFLLREAPRTIAMTERTALTDALLRELAVLRIFPNADHPLDLLFSDPSLRPRAAHVHPHLLKGTVPPGSFLRLSEHVLISSPELCFAQLAGSLSPEKLILTGFGLCGSFACVPNPAKPGKTMLVDRTPLTTAADIRTFLTAPSTMRTGEATRAATHILNNAASPMEARVAMLLTLPLCLGGYGLPRPLLNESITLSGEARRAYPLDTCRPDIFWPVPKIDIEYDGRDSHEGEWAHAKDVARITALELMGVDVTVLTYPQVADDAVFDSIATKLARNLHVRLRPRFTEGTHAGRRAHLREELNLT